MFIIIHKSCLCQFHIQEHALNILAVQNDGTNFIRYFEKKDHQGKIQNQ